MCCLYKYCDNLIYMNGLIIVKMESNKKPSKFKFVPKIPERKLENKPVNVVDDEGKIVKIEEIKPIEEPTEEIKWIKWEDRIEDLSYDGLICQIKWLKENIFVDDKNFFYYVKKHRSKITLLMIREAGRMLKSEYASKMQYFKNKYNPDIEKTIDYSPFKLKEKIIREKNQIYYSLFEEYKRKNNSVNRLFGITRVKILNIDDKMKYALKRIQNKEQLFSYLYESEYKTITVNY